MDIELIETLQLIIKRYGERTTGSVFIPMSDFHWYNERNGQLTRLQEAGMITKPRFYDNGVDITLTQAGRHFFDEQVGSVSLTKEKIYEILMALYKEMKIPEDCFGYERREAYRAIKQIQEEGLISGAIFVGSEQRRGPLTVWLDNAYITMAGRNYIDGFEKVTDDSSIIDLPHEFISACAKIADNPESYVNFDENGLNREVRNFLDSAIARFGYTIADQTQQGIGKTDKRAGELDIRISKNGIPVAIYEGLIHSTKQYLDDHIDKAIGKYNQSGCKSVFVVEFSRNKGFGGFWDNACDILEEHDKVSVKEENTGLLGVKMLKGTFDWEGQEGNFYYIGVNCYVKLFLTNSNY